MTFVRCSQVAMTPSRTRTERPSHYLLPLVLALSAGGCTCERARGEQAPAPVSVGCRSACAALGDCATTVVRPDVVARCGQRCEPWARRMRGYDCSAQLDAYLDCVSRSPQPCAEPATATATDVQQLVQSVPAVCSSERKALLACTTPCESAGTHLGQRHLDAGLQLFAYENAGCGNDCGELPRGAPQGSPCQAARVCAAACCACPGDARVRFSAQVCANGRCTATPEACRVPADAGPCR